MVNAKPVVVMCLFCGKANRVDLSRLAEGPKCGNCGRPIRLDRPLKVTDADFDKRSTGASVPVLVDFYADWCGPCQVMAPILDDFARQHTGELLVLKLDTDANQATRRALRDPGYSRRSSLPERQARPAATWVRSQTCRSPREAGAGTREREGLSLRRLRRPRRRSPPRPARPGRPRPAPRSGATPRTGTPAAASIAIRAPLVGVSSSHRPAPYW